MKNRCDDASQTCCARKTWFFRHPGRMRFGVNFGLLGTCLSIPGSGRSLCCPRTSLGLSGCSLDTPRRPETLLGATGSPQTVPGPISSRFCMPGACPGRDFGSISTTILTSNSQASWTANDISLDCQAHVVKQKLDKIEADEELDDQQQECQSAVAIDHDK